MTAKLIRLCCEQGSYVDPHPDTGTPSLALSKQEVEVLCLVATGVRTKDVATRLAVDESAVKEHIKSLLYKAIIKTKPHLVLPSRRR